MLTDRGQPFRPHRCPSAQAGAARGPRRTSQLAQRLPCHRAGRPRSAGAHHRREKTPRQGARLPRRVTCRAGRTCTAAIPSRNSPQPRAAGRTRRHRSRQSPLPPTWRLRLQAVAAARASRHAVAPHQESQARPNLSAARSRRRLMAPLLSPNAPRRDSLSSRERRTAAHCLCLQHRDGRPRKPRGLSRRAAAPGVNWRSPPREPARVPPVIFHRGRRY